MEYQEKEYFMFKDVKINNVNYNQISKIIQENVSGKSYVCLTCVHTISEAVKDPLLFKIINTSLLSIPDGMPLVWYGKLSGFKTVERVSGVELMKRFFEEENDFKHFLLGDTKETINDVITKAKKANNKVRIVGYSPPFKKEFNRNDNRRMLDRINSENPDIIWVSFGWGKQERWIYQNLHDLNRGVMIAIGAAFKFYTGRIPIPPRLIQQLGLQWLTRTLQHPVKAGRNQIRKFPKFIVQFPLEIVKSRARGSTVIKRIY